MTILIATIGFEEKFLIRAILRHLNEGISEIFIIRTEESDDRLKMEKAIENVKSLAKEVSIPVHEVGVSVNNVLDALNRIAQVVTEETEERIVVNLSGGLRALGIEVLLSLILSEKLNALLEIELENLSGVITFKLGDVLPGELRREDLILMGALLKGSMSLSEICKSLNLPKSSAWRRVKGLIDKGYVSEFKENRRSVFELTTKGKLRLSLVNLKNEL